MDDTFNETSRTARQLHEDIERTLRIRKPTQGKPGREVVHHLKHGGRRVWRTMKRHPFISAAAIAGGAVGLAAVVGASELTFATAIAFALYKVLREGEPPLQAIEEVERAFKQ